MLDLNDLRVLVQVVDHGGFSAASRALNLPKQTLSKRLVELERQAGARLIHRTSRRFVVTELGQELYRHASAMMAEASAAEDVLLGRTAEPSGLVRITASFPDVQEVLGPLLAKIATRYPKIRLVLHASDRNVDVVKEGYDLAVRSHSRPLPDSDLVQKRLKIEQIWILASPQYLAVDHLTNPSQISSHRAISSGAATNEWTLFGPDGTRLITKLDVAYTANEGTAILAAAEAGLGICFLPASMCRDAIEKGSLVRICPQWTAGLIMTTLLMPHRRGILPSVRVVADAIVEALAVPPSGSVRGAMSSIASQQAAGETIVC